METGLVGGVIAAAQEVPVSFAFEPPIEAQTVTLAGEFNSWDKGAMPMSDDDRDGVWEITIELEPGRYQYKFVVNGDSWFQDPENPRAHPDGFGGFNSVAYVGNYGKFMNPSQRGDGSIMLEAVRHEKEPPLLTSGVDKLYIRLRTKRDDVEKVELVYRTPKTRAQRSEIQTIGADEIFEYFQIIVEPKPPAMRYRFVISDGDTLFNYIDESGPAGFPTDFSFEEGDLKIIDTPDWVKSAVFYQIFPERFRNGDPSNDPPGVEPWGGKPEPHNFFGGDLKGITQGLGYLDSLGVTALYLNPIFESVSNHKYDTQNYMEIDDNFGDLEVFKRMVDESHRHGMRVVIDGVFNHVGDEFWAFQDVKRKGPESKYADWFTIHSFPVVGPENPNYDGWWGIGHMPTLNTWEPEVREHLFDVTRFWTCEGDVDGWRLDVAQDVEHEFWEDWREVVKGCNPYAYIVGEIWGDGSPWLLSGEFDGVMNYRFRDAVISFLTNPAGDASDLDVMLSEIRIDYPDNVFYSLLNLLGSHDTERFKTLMGGDVQAAKLATFLQMTYPGAPCIYYGDEVGMEGGRDPDCRRTFPWSKERQDLDMLEYVRNLIILRHEHPSLTTGGLRTLYAQGEIYAFLREGKKESAVVVVARGVSAGDMTVSIPVPFVGGTVLENPMTGARLTVTTDGMLNAPLSRMQGSVYFYVN
jgi:glycosidase